ncbi:MAG TPA: hypothetical protein DC042_09160 [Bacteroidales bacterium]|nr:hypothetical protein [Bacteroidales bacterium]
MKKLILILFALSIPFLAVYSQDSYIKNRWDIKAGYARYDGLWMTKTKMKPTYANYRIEANYGLLDFLEVGGYLGYSRFTAFVPQVGKIVSENHDAPFFGVDLNFHPLTFLLKKPDFRFDLYLLARYGGIYFFSPEGYDPQRGFEFQYHHGAGLAFYLTKHFGIFSEYSYGIPTVPSWSMRFGLSLKFH